MWIRAYFRAHGFGTGKYRITTGPQIYAKNYHTNINKNNCIGANVFDTFNDYININFLFLFEVSYL